MKINYMIYIIILFLINSFIVIINKVKFITNTSRSLVVRRSKELMLRALITSVFRVLLLSNK